MITKGDEGKARPTMGVDSAGYLRRVGEPPQHLQQPISSGGCHHCRRGGRPPVGCPQVNRVLASYQVALRGSYRRPARGRQPCGAGGGGAASRPSS